MVASRENFPLLAELLAEQQRLQTPVALFSAAETNGSAAGPSLARQLIPLSRPGPGEQYAFEVALESCTGCKSCVAACHALNGLDEQETWRDVGLVISTDRRQPFSQTVTTACHHCADPACLNGCPVLAYEKDPITGIVQHLDDQCIGCQYCILKCPYDAPKYNARLGIVRKCDMCQGRLAEGEAPACAQACPTQAIRIVTVPIAKPEGLPLILPLRTSTGLAGALPDPAYTRPTTLYLEGRAATAKLVAADEKVLRLHPAHWPLVIMLTLLPVAVGGQAAASLRPEGSVEQFRMLLGAWLAGAIGLAASSFHLGQPWRAWRIFLGWRRSWLSREAMVFAAWLGASTLSLVEPALIGPGLVLGVAGLGCSAMIYIDTRRTFWCWTETVPRFFGTALVFALAQLRPEFAAFALLGKMAWESRTFFDGSRSTRLQRVLLRQLTLTRHILGVLGVVGLLVAPGPMAFALVLAGELTERLIFFRAVDAPKMPGMPA